MKKFGVLIATLVLMIVFAISANALNRYWNGYLLTEDDFAYELVDEEIIIRGYIGSNSNLIIPSEIDGYPVTTIGQTAFHNKTKITEVTIPDSVTTIEDDAFSRCYNLSTINMSKNIIRMGYTVFWGTEWYHNYKAGDLIYIGNVLYEFKVTSNATYEDPTKITIKDGTKCIAGDALRYLNDTEEITIPDSVEYIGVCAFNEIEKLKIINMGKGVKTIAKSAFGNNNIVTVNYNASKLHWDDIDIDERNDPIINANIIFNDIGHSVTDTTIYNPTCTTSGYTSCICECGENFIYNTIEAKGHVYVTTITVPTCTNRGYTTYLCGCGDTYVSDYIDKIPHNYIASITTPATHLKEGVKTFKCSSCGDSYVESIEKETKHTYTVLNVVRATCTNQGYTTYICDCGDSYSDNYTSAKGHSYNGQTCIECGDNCSCNCHKDGFMGFFWKIINFFNKLFKSKQYCGCGAKHW